MANESAKERYATFRLQQTLRKRASANTLRLNSTRSSGLTLGEQRAKRKYEQKTQARLFNDMLQEMSRQYLLDQEEKRNGWLMLWQKRKEFTGTVKATFISLLAGGQYNVRYLGKVYKATGRGDGVLRLGDVVDLTPTDTGYSISW